MLVLAPAACCLAGIAMHEVLSAFATSLRASDVAAAAAAAPEISYAAPSSVAVEVKEEKKGKRGKAAHVTAVPLKRSKEARVRRPIPRDVAITGLLGMVSSSSTLWLLTLLSDLTMALICKVASKGCEGFVLLLNDQHGCTSQAVTCRVVFSEAAPSS